MNLRFRIFILAFLVALLYSEGLPFGFLAPFALLLLIFIFLRDRVWKRAEKEVELRLPFSKSWPSWARWLLVFLVFFLLYYILKSAIFYLASLLGFDFQNALFSPLNATGK